ncbi:MAG: ABC transporter permease [marine bacterium B5-7]|nr:MAG: ABC transporter permease [marine bacterium B5-7]
MPSEHRKSAHYLLGAISVVAGLTIWAIAAWYTDSALLPTPVSVLKSFSEMTQTGDLYQSVFDSASRVIIGYLIGTLAGISTGVILGGSKLISELLSPLFDFFKGLPPIALVPIAIMWFGIGEMSKYVVIAYIVWIVVAVSTLSGLREVPTIRIKIGQIMGLSHFQIYMKIALPTAMPYIFLGMRTAIGFAYVALVSAELIGANTGIGYLIMDYRFSLQTSKMIAAIVLLGVLGSLTQMLFDIIIKRTRLYLK